MLHHLTRFLGNIINCIIVSKHAHQTNDVTPCHVALCIRHSKTYHQSLFLGWHGDATRHPNSCTSNMEMLFVTFILLVASKMKVAVLRHLFFCYDMGRCIRYVVVADAVTSTIDHMLNDALCSQWM